MKRNLKWTSLIILLLCCASTVTALDRRKAQFQKDPAYLILPMPYSFPGIGEGLMVSAMGANMFGSYTDLFVVTTTGDVKGNFFGLMDLHLIPETLFIDIYAQNLTAQFQNYRNRGMNDGDPEYQILNAKNRNATIFCVTLSLFDRRFEIEHDEVKENVEMDKVLDEEGELLIEFDTPQKSEARMSTTIVLLDLTDDRQDPWQGFRLRAEHSSMPPADEREADFDVLDLSASVYLPVGKASTWAFNYRTSEAIVHRKGDNDPEHIRSELGLDCAAYDQCSAEEKTLIDKYVSERTYGTASSLGGEDLMRAYPMGRFKGAHMAYLGTEFRWNFATDVIPFDFWIWKDIATGFQLALFHEIATVAEQKSQLWEDSRSSTGAGLRMVSGSGIVYRFDMAYGDEGRQTSIIFNYPW